MDHFLQLNWGIKEPHELEFSSEFIPEHEISLSYVFRGLDQRDDNESEGKEVETKSTETKQQLVPGQHYTFNSDIRSFLNQTEHAKCLTALGLIQNGKKPVGTYERGCMELYTNSHLRILQENKKYLQFAKQQFGKSKNKNFKFKPLLKKYSESLWRFKFERCKDYKQYYKTIDMLAYSYKEDEEPVEMLHIQNLLELGTLARFSGPTLLKPYYLKKTQMFSTKLLYHSNQAVSKDINIQKLLETNLVDIVISSSGLTRLLTYVKAHMPWDIPVVVKKIQFQNADGTQKEKCVIFIDKPFPIRTPNIFDLNRNCFKNSLKSSFCEAEAFSFQNTEAVIGSYEIHQNTNNQSTESTKKLKLSGQGEAMLSKNNTHHNVSYRIWKLQLKNEQCELMKDKYRTNNIHVLVRCKLDGCESTENGQLQPISIVPKVEYHLEYGGGVPTVDEIAKQWVYGYFRPCSQVRRVRVHYNTGEVIAIDKCTIQKTVLEAQTHHQYNPHLGLGVLYKIFNRLLLLTPGNYILHHLAKDESFVALLQEISDGDDASYDLYAEYSNKNCKIGTNKSKRWHTIDSNYILPKHIGLQQMPGLFRPCVNAIKGPRKTGKKNKKKRKIKIIKKSNPK